MIDQQRQILDLTNRLERVEKADAGLSRGTSFPASPADGLLFYRTDLDFLCVYDSTNTQWVTVQEWECVVTISSLATITFTTTQSAARRGLVRNSHKAYFTRAEVFTNLAAGTSNGANFWTVAVVAVDNATTIWSFTTAADSANANTFHATATVSAQPSAAETVLRLDLTESGAPPDIIPLGTVLWYRLVIT